MRNYLPSGLGVGGPHPDRLPPGGGGDPHINAYSYSPINERKLPQIFNKIATMLRVTNICACEFQQMYVTRVGGACDIEHRALQHPACGRTRLDGRLARHHPQVGRACSREREAAHGRLLPCGRRCVRTRARACRLRTQMSATLDSREPAWRPAGYECCWRYLRRQLLALLTFST